MPSSTCLRTISSTALAQPRAVGRLVDRLAAAPWPRSCSSRSAGRGRLPTWVVRIRSVLFFIAALACWFHRFELTRFLRRTGSPLRRKTLWIKSTRPGEFDSVEDEKRGRKQRMPSRTACLALLGLFVLTSSGHAQSTYPSRPVRIVVPSPPAGGTDIIARVLAENFSNAMGQQFFVENRPGAGNMIGIESVARAAPDGYTFLMSASTLVAQLRASTRRSPTIRSRISRRSRSPRRPERADRQSVDSGQDADEFIALAKASPAS